jgi:hypothetical protein
MGVYLFLGAALLVIAVLRTVDVTSVDRTGPVDQTANGSALRTIRVRTVDRDPTGTNTRKIEHGVFDLIAGETTSIPSQDLPTERPLVLNLLLPASLTSADALPVRVLAMDGSGELKLSDGLVATDSNRVRVQIESGWLSPGSYRIEIETTEGSELALRSYLLEIF